MDLSKIFTYHPPFGNQPARYEALRAKAKELAQMIDDCCPESREKSLAITNVQQSIMWANASIAVNESPTRQEAQTANFARAYSKERTEALIEAEGEE